MDARRREHGEAREGEHAQTDEEEKTLGTATLHLRVEFVRLATGVRVRVRVSMRKR